MKGPWAAVQRLLCVRLDSIGDVLMTTPAIRALRESLPDSEITLLTSPAGGAIARMTAEVDRVVEYEAPWMKATAAGREAEADIEIVDWLRDQHFDAAVIFTVFSQSALPAAMLCRLAGIPLTLARCRENPYQLLTDWLHEDEPADGIRHEVERQLSLVRAIGATARTTAMSLRAPRPAVERMERLLEQRGLGCRGWVLVHPGASAPSRRYPAAEFAAAARSLNLHDGLDVVVTGSCAERDLTTAVANEVPGAIDLAGELGLDDLVALIQRAPLVITNNTGPAHIAAALGTPVVDLYAGTNPQHTPWQGPSRVLTHRVACAPCFKSICPEGHNECLRGIGFEEVVAAARELLCETAESRR